MHFFVLLIVLPKHPVHPDSNKYQLHKPGQKSLKKESIEFWLMSSDGSVHRGREGRVEQVQFTPEQATEERRMTGSGRG